MDLARCCRNVGLLALLAALAACSGGGGAQGGGGGGTTSGGDPGTGGGDPPPGGSGVPGEGPWSGVGDPYAGTSGILVDVLSPAHVLSPAYVLSGTVASSVTQLSVSVDGGAPLTVTPAGGTFTAALVLRPGVNGISVGASEGAVVRPPLNVMVTYEDGTPSSGALISAALAAGEITAEQAVEYRVLGAFGDARLPAQYRGRQAPDGTVAMLDAWMAASTLSEETRRRLAPFFTPELYVQSRPAATTAARSRALTRPCNDWTGEDAHCDPSEDWEFVESTNVKVWYDRRQPADAVKARTVLDALEGVSDDSAWRTLRSIMTWTPVPEPEFGGDAKLDVLLVDLGPGLDGVTTPARLFRNAPPVPVFIRVNRNLPPRRLRSAAVHELMHAFQLGMPLAGGSLARYHSLAEATANWAANRVFPTDNWEHQYNFAMFQNPSRGLLSVIDPSTDHFPYSTWLFYLHLTKALGDHVIGAIWNEATRTADQLEVLKRAILLASGNRDDLEEAWRAFAPVLWNGPWGLWEWDEIFTQPTPFEGAPIPVVLGAPQPVNAVLPALSTRYVQFKFDDPRVNSALWLDGAGHEVRPEPLATTALGQALEGYAIHPLAEEARRGVHLRATRKVNGTWQPIEDWTAAQGGWVFFPPDEGYVSDGYAYLCNDLASTGLEELTVMISYGDVSAPGKVLAPSGMPPALVPSPAPCSGVSVEATYETEPPEGSSVVYKQSLKGWMDAAVAWELDTEPPGGVIVAGIQFMGWVDEGSWSVSGVDEDGCRHSGSGTLAFPADGGPLTVYTFARSPHDGAVDWRGLDVSSQCGTWRIECPPPPDDPDPQPRVSERPGSIEPITFDSYFTTTSTTLQPKLKVGADGTMTVDVRSLGFEKARGSVVVKAAAAP